MTPYELQDLVSDLMKGTGYNVGWTAPPGKDGGVDTVTFNDLLGTRPPRIKFQVKRQQQRICVDGVRSFMAVLAAEAVGLFVNTGAFTKDAKDEARSQQVRRITLIDLERLIDLWTQNYTTLESIWFLRQKRERSGIALGRGGGRRPARPVSCDHSEDSFRSRFSRIYADAGISDKLGVYLFPHPHACA